MLNAILHNLESSGELLQGHDGPLVAFSHNDFRLFSGCLTPYQITEFSMRPN